VHEEQLWPSREESAASNLRRAIYDVKGDFVVEWIERGSTGYFVLFRKGNRVHRELQIDLAVLEDGPDPDALHKLETALEHK
jgi:hypothetical protein